MILLEKNHKSLENRIISLQNELKGMNGRIQEIDHSKQSMVEEKNSLKTEIKIIKEQLYNSLPLNNTKCKLDIKPIKTHHEHHKISLHRIVVGIEEQNNEDTLEIVNK